MALMASAKPQHVPKFGLANGRIIGGHEAEPRMYTAAFYLQSIFILTKGQLISKCLIGSIVSTKKPTIFF